MRLADRIADAAERPRILVVDPDQHSRAALAARLSRLGYQALATRSAEEAVRIVLETRSLHGAVVAAPLADAPAAMVVHRLRTARVGREIPVLVVLRDPADEAALEAAGADEIVAGPVDPEQVTGELAALLRRAFWPRRSAGPRIDWMVRQPA